MVNSYVSFSGKFYYITEVVRPWEERNYGLLIYFLVFPMVDMEQEIN